MIESQHSIELEFATVAEAEEFDRAAAQCGMSSNGFVLWLFNRYRQVSQPMQRDNVVDLEAFMSVKHPELPPRKPMARAVATRVLLEAVKELLEEVG
jgi:hypothetical protein